METPILNRKKNHLLSEQKSFIAQGLRSQMSTSIVVSSIVSQYLRIKAVLTLSCMEDLPFGDAVAFVSLCSCRWTLSRRLSRANETS